MGGAKEGKGKSLMREIDGITVFGDTDAKTLEQAKHVRQSAEYVALMADNHLGYIMPVGGVAAYRNKVSVSGVGFDIACGNCAIKTDLSVEDLGGRIRLEEIADQIQSEISFGVGRKNKSDDAPSRDPLFVDDRWHLVPEAHRSDLMDKARKQLGTVGSGNHYVDVFCDTNGRIWVGVHFGSRGLGHTIATAYLSISAGGKWGDKTPEHDALLGLDTETGKDYWDLMSLAGEYAYAGRDWVCRKVVRLFGGRATDTVHNNHNFAWQEQHSGETFIVVRKGATPAFPGQLGFVGGSMGDESVILRGSVHSSIDKNLPALCSTVHGAGRVMSRTQAAGKTKRFKAWACGVRGCAGSLPIKTTTEDGSNPRCPKCGAKTHKREIREKVSEGMISPEMMQEWLGRKGVILRGGGLDEAPQAYRRLPDVLAAQGNTIEILETLRPLVVVMAGADEFDPYKD